MCLCVFSSRIPVFHSQSPSMVFSAYQLTKEAGVSNGQTEEQRDGVHAVCLSVQTFECMCMSVWKHIWMCTGVDAETWRLSGWGAYENISPWPRTNLYLSNVSSGDWQSNTQDASLLLSPKTKSKVMILLGVCYVFEWCSWAGYVLSVASWLYVGLRISREHYRKE